ncbi:putative transcription factor C2H2 family [Helianthus anomalus]
MLWKNACMKNLNGLRNLCCIVHSLRNDLPKAIENVVEKSRFVNEKEEYRSDCMIGTLRCKHSYHEECIKKWLKRKKSSCPLCRGSAFLYQ